MILAHNHPSGVIGPEPADEYITRRLQDALALMDVRVLDHLIVGDGQLLFLLPSMACSEHAASVPGC